MEPDWGFYSLIDRSADTFKSIQPFLMLLQYTHLTPICICEAVKSGLDGVILNNSVVLRYTQDIELAEVQI